MNEYNIAVDFQNGNIYTDLSVLVQNDYEAYKLKFDFDKEFNRALFKLKYPVNDKVWIQEIVDNQLTLPVLQNIGDYEYEIAIYSETGRLTDYATETFHVRSELISTDEIVESDDRVPILDNLINEVNTLESNVTTAEENRVLAEQARVNNETERISNETSRVENETTRQTYETTRVNNESARVTAENKRILAESERVSNEITRQTNEVTRISNEEIRVSQENAREEYITDLKERVDSGEFDGECNFATFEIDVSTGELIMHKTEDLLLDFDINENGELEVLI